MRTRPGHQGSQILGESDRAELESFKAANLTAFIVNNASNANFEPNVVNNAYLSGIADRERKHTCYLV